MTELFSFEGRLNRTDYIGRLFIYIFLSYVLDVALGASWVGIILSFTLSWWGLSITARRLHDIGLSGWFQLVPCAIIFTLYLLAIVFEVAVLVYISIAVTVIYALYLLCCLGTPGRNQFDRRLPESIGSSSDDPQSRAAILKKHGF